MGRVRTRTHIEHVRKGKDLNGKIARRYEKLIILSFIYYNVIKGGWACLKV